MMKDDMLDKKKERGKMNCLTEVSAKSAVATPGGKADRRRRYHHDMCAHISYLNEHGLKICSKVTHGLQDGTFIRSYVSESTYLLRVFHPLITDVQRCIGIELFEETTHVVHVCVRVIICLEEPLCIVQVRLVYIVERLKGFHRQIFPSVWHGDVYR